MRKHFLQIVGAALTCTCLTALISEAETFTVEAGGKYPTISSALAKMKDGDVCLIKAGLYRELIEIPQNKVTLRGEGRVVVTGCDEAGKGSPATINGLDCLVFDVEKPVYDAFFSKCAFEYISPFQHNAHPKGRGGKQGQTMFSQWGSPEHGSAGIFVRGDGFVAENCRFAKSWWCGMMLRGNKARIENCLFEDMNWMARRSAGFFCWGDDNVVRYCTLRNLGGAGIEGGNANWVGQYAKRNIWEYNFIEDVCKLIVDQGVFYVNHQTGDRPPSDSEWRYNVAKTGKGPTKGGWSRAVAAYYVDNSSSGFHIHNNIAIDVINPMKHNDFQGGDKGARDVWYYNNTFFNCGNSAIYIKRRTPIPGGVNVVNNLAVPGGNMSTKGLESFVNNHLVKERSVFRNANAMDFTPTREDLVSGGVPVMGKAITYIGAVDPEKGMWRYGADESQLPATETNITAQ